MGANTKTWIRQLLLGMVIAVVSGVGGGWIASEKTSAVNNYKIEESIKKIDILETKKADRMLVIAIKEALNDRLGRLETGQDEIQRDIKKLLEK
jgi:hypothetical protein